MNIQNLMQQAQKMQKKMASLDAEFKNEIFKTETGGGAVTITMNGDMKIIEVKMSDELIKSQDHEMIADLFTAAVNQSIDTVKKEKETRLSKVVGKMGGMPGLF
ncbi:MAG TPA: YbaB/EbfC family nucleoid-associated protein [bacterium]|nr:YbaB/EbfC family nucleoid-associated protein [bacterium]MDX9805565.1 YbaB/EbfC family nucleoid-associated protein [bacterium]HNW15789.1 YbaB/EbfC family nucleoid-associated protein [bacterium]HNZ54862.1 YbaB/EbfC family nucleoid-associated protein [bacterium]HOB72690.1 YbaB/EbfC family nucleoid-associated protein [bacterium]